MPAAKVRVRVVGACEIAVGRTRIRPDAAVLFALVLYLSSRAGERIQRSELLDFLWSGMPDAGRKHALRQLVYRLRKAGLDLGDDSELGLSAGSVESDINLICREGWAGNVELGAIPHPSAVLAGCNPTVSPPFGEWIEALRQEVSRSIRRAALRHIAAARREGRWVDVERMARTCLATDPLNEEATLALAEATMMSGAKAEALRILDAYLWEIGDKAKEIGLPAKQLRRRISDRPSFRVPRSGEAPLTGRSADLAWLNDFVDSTPTDSVRSLLLVGAPGVGKTALVRAFVSQLEFGGWRAPEARLQPSDVSRPMSLIVELLPTLLKMEGALGAAPESMVVIKQLLQHDAPGESNPARLQDAPAFPAKVRMAVSDLVSAIADEGPVVLVLEDLHWIDTQSLMTLEWMLEKMRDKPVLLLLSSRPESQYANLRATLARLQLTERQVTSLNAEASRTLFMTLADGAGAATLADEVFSLTGGNPLFIGSIAAHCSEGGTAADLPGSLRDLIRGRVNQFSPAAQRVLHACAMLGRYASASRVARVLEMPTSELLSAVEELDSLGLMGLNAEAGSLALHDLWQEELLAGLRTASKALLHLRCGEVLEREAIESRAAAIIHDAARHLVAADAAGRALTLLEESARYQLESGFSEAAVRSAEQALVVATQQEDRLRVRAVYLRSLQSVGNWLRIIELCPIDSEDIGGSAIIFDRPFAEILLGIEGLWRLGVQVERALHLAMRLAEEEHLPQRERAAACLVAGQIASNQLDRTSLLRIHEALEGILRNCEILGPTELAARIVLETEIGDLRLGAMLAERLLKEERESQSTLGLARALRFAAYPLRAIGDHDRAVAYSTEAYAITSKHEMLEQAAQAALVIATASIDREDWATASNWTHRAAAWATRAGLRHLRRAVATSYAEIAIGTGRVEEATHALARLDPQEPLASAREEAEVMATRLLCAVRSGDHQQVHDRTEQLELKLRRGERFLRQDASVAAYLTGLRFLGKHEAAARYRERYLVALRRETAPLPPSLLTA